MAEFTNNSNVILGPDPNHQEILSLVLTVGNSASGEVVVDGDGVDSVGGEGVVEAVLQGGSMDVIRIVGDVEVVRMGHVNDLSDDDAFNIMQHMYLCTVMRSPLLNPHFNSCIIEAS
ncbi:hypothetical protein CFOL_v3_03489 [Cephalotus follicularis]|uniref:Uncharacterized protein n=1 Tax=Cephalotus follicularis TaxID=3775 RepID=A0A1Q3AW49_CEPFO|nr:hypothetical protein CFOL_v3_03489 [Cephalotus follicularis]